MRRHILAALTIAWVVCTGVASWQLLIPRGFPPPAPTPGIAREDFTVDFEGFRATAQLTYPESAVASLPLVILVAGTGPADLDVTIAGPDGAFSHRLFRDISDSLTLRGYATVRYNKRHVESATEHPSEEEYPLRVTPQQLQDDLARVYAAVSAHPRVDRSRVVLYGWSEGALIATGLALDHPEIAGVILHAPLAGTYLESSRFQLLDLGQAYLRDDVDTDRDGYVSRGELRAAWQRGAGVSLQPLLAAITESSWTGRKEIHDGLDWDSDGRLDIDDEFVRILTAHFAVWDKQSAEEGLGAYTTTGQPIPIRERLSGYAGPLLLLHGANDGSVPIDDTRLLAVRLDEAGYRDSTVRLYPGLGHTLGPSTSRYRDLYAPVAPDVLAEIGDWLDQHYRR